ncbi:MAG TPA: redoxin domain-containing protein [Oculatellaceae cyanobacterium]
MATAIVATKTLSIGDPAPLFRLPDQDGKNTYLANNVGGPIVLLFYARDTIAECEKLAVALNRQQARLTELSARILSISPESSDSRKAFREKHQLFYPLLSDEDLHVCTQYGVLIPPNQEPTGQLAFRRTIFLLNRNLQILKIYQGLSDADKVVSQLLEDIQRLCPQESSYPAHSHPPVLVIPNVLDRAFCRHLIDVWHTQGHEESGFMKQDGERTIGVLDPNRKIRQDHFVQPGPLKAQLDRLISRRVFPEIEKCFNDTPTRQEGYKIACYDASTGGYFRAHRDNTTGGTAHRRWAMTLNLNSEEYEGGYLWFPEYGPCQYKPETGSAVIFSCSLMHEATDVLSGRRFVLINFFYGDKEATERAAYEEKYGTDAYETLVRYELNHGSLVFRHPVCQ